MTRTAHATARLIIRLIQPMGVAIAAFAVSTALFLYVLYAFNEQNEKQRVTLCDLVQPIAASPQPPGNDRALRFQESADRAAHTLECSEDPYDGK